MMRGGKKKAGLTGYTVQKEKEDRVRIKMKSGETQVVKWKEEIRRAATGSKE